MCLAYVESSLAVCVYVVGGLTTLHCTASELVCFLVGLILLFPIVIGWPSSLSGTRLYEAFSIPYELLH